MSIDRASLVGRHDPVLDGFAFDSPLSVGNGELAFTVDATGLQTCAAGYEETVPLCTQAQWAWHSFPPPRGFSRKRLRLAEFDARGRRVGYAVSSAGQEELYHHLRMNPHRLNLARIGLACTHNWRAPEPADISAARQRLDLRAGIIHSAFVLRGTPLEVKTCCHPTLDAIGVSIRPAIPGGTAPAVSFEFPYGSPEMNASDWRAEALHTSEQKKIGSDGSAILRTLDADRYSCAVFHPPHARLERLGRHRFLLHPGQAGPLEFVCCFSPGPWRTSPLRYAEIEQKSRERWAAFWDGGGALDLSDSDDPRSYELERRTVLSQYLTAIQCAGSLPPAETGLTCNSWYGKFHLEMHYWHAAHFALWGRADLFERSLDWYRSILRRAKALARSQGYRGARWPKMTSPDGFDSPSPIGPLLIWQQPHPIMYAELCYRARPTRETLRAWADIVFPTAEFMASYASRDGARYSLGPPLIPAQENHRPQECWNPPYELEYWRWGLETAALWRRRLGRTVEARWENVARALAPLPQHNGVYMAHENCPGTFGAYAHDHPSMLGALGLLPGAGVEAAVMNATLEEVMKSWDFDRTWGWDFPMMAMTAARLGRPETAVDLLLMDAPKNTYLANGHNAQRPRRDLPLYLPGNGGLLLAVAMMAAGWDGAPTARAPGFPPGWRVACENLLPYI